jgi:hypothetical protein
MRPCTGRSPACFPRDRTSAAGSQAKPHRSRHCKVNVRLLRLPTFSRPIPRPLPYGVPSPNRRAANVPVGFRHPLTAHPGSDCGLLNPEELCDLPHAAPIGTKRANHACDSIDLSTSGLCCLLDLEASILELPNCRSFLFANHRGHPRVRCRDNESHAGTGLQLLALTDTLL